METSYGLKYELVTEINPEWNAFDKVIAETHLSNYGIIIVDSKYMLPIDNEYDLDQIYKIIESTKQK